MKTEELLTQWLESYEKQRVKLRTYNRYKDLLRLHVLPTIGDVDIKDLTRKEIQDFKGEKSFTRI